MGFNAIWFVIEVIWAVPSHHLNHWWFIDHCIDIVLPKLSRFGTRRVDKNAWYNIQRKVPQNWDIFIQKHNYFDIIVCKVITILTCEEIEYQLMNYSLYQSQPFCHCYHHFLYLNLRHGTNPGVSQGYVLSLFKNWPHLTHQGWLMHIYWKTKSWLVRIMTCCLFGTRPILEPVLSYSQINP